MFPAFGLIWLKSNAVYATEHCYLCVSIIPKGTISCTRVKFCGYLQLCSISMLINYYVNIKILCIWEPYLSFSIMLISLEIIFIETSNFTHLCMYMTSKCIWHQSYCDLYLQFGSNICSFTFMLHQEILQIISCLSGLAVAVVPACLLGCLQVGYPY